MVVKKAPLALLSGEVGSGRQLGRELGFPTANLAVAEGVSVANGVYVAEAEVDGECYRAMANLGVNPSVGGDERHLEVHLFDYHGASLYGKRLSVRLLHFLREERCFASLEALRAQLDADKKASLAYFSQTDC